MTDNEKEVRRVEAVCPDCEGERIVLRYYGREEVGTEACSTCEGRGTVTTNPNQAVEGSVAAAEETERVNAWATLASNDFRNTSARADALFVIACELRRLNRKVEALADSKEKG